MSETASTVIGAEADARKFIRPKGGAVYLRLARSLDGIFRFVVGPGGMSS